MQKTKQHQKLGQHWNWHKKISFQKTRDENYWFLIKRICAALKFEMCFCMNIYEPVVWFSVSK